MIVLNVGGTTFQTTTQTLYKCRRFKELLCANTKRDGTPSGTPSGTHGGTHSGGCDPPIFLDRDPVVFARMLKFLRGYPISQIETDHELICELIYWQHYFTDIALCPCISGAAVKYHQIAECVNLPDSTEVNHYSKTHFLIPLEVALKLFTELEHVPNPRMPLFQVVCSPGWNDHVWVEHDVWKQKMYKCKLQCSLYNRRYCLGTNCGKFQSKTL